MKYPFALYLMLILHSPFPCQRLVPPGRIYNPDDDDDHPNYNAEIEEDEYVHVNATDEKGQYVGAPCDGTCSPSLSHVYCNEGICECDRKYPVKLNNPYAGCTKPKRLGDQCYYKEACMYSDQHSSCVQVHHNAICQCQAGYHSVSIQKPSKRVFCAEDVVVITSDFSTFAGVLSGIAILSGLICFVLHLFNQNLYGSHHRRHRFGNANLAPPILFASDPGSLPLPMMCYERSVTMTASRASSSSAAHRSYASMTTTTGAASRRASSAPGFRAAAAVASRAGSRRPSVASVHSSSSIRSYGARRFERERLQKEEREMERKFSKLSRANSLNRVAPTPSPHSTDDLLPTLEEDKQIPPLATKEDSSSSFAEEVPSTSKQYP